MIELLRFWSKTGRHQLDFLLTGGQPGIFDDDARALGAQIYYARYSRATLFEFAKAFRDILRANHYDAVHDHQDYISGWHFLIGIGRLPDVRVAHVHNPWLHIETNYASSPLRKLSTLIGKWLVYALATQVCGTSIEVLRLYDFSPEKPCGPDVFPAYCGFEVAKFNGPTATDRAAVRREFGWPDDAKIILIAGRLDRALQYDHPTNHKNSWFGLNVVRSAAAKDSSIRLLMAGAGESRDKLQEQVCGWSLGDEFRLLGVRADIPRLMRSADALLFPSRQEGLGMVAVEAQAAGLPVLASTAVPRECIVIPELYDALPLSESVESWANALLTTMAKPRLMPEACRDALQASPFSIENSARQLEAIYGSAAS